MGGKWAIHPNQITAIEQTFTPSAERIAQARKQKAAYQAAQQEGRGAISVDGVMVDAASIRIIQSLLDRADVLGL
jgi:citrate lyase subunit beta/citryl-CoA lyase